MYNVDLISQRKDNLRQDLELLAQREAMNFSEPLNLDDVVRIGLENNLDLRISRIMAEIADDEAWAEKLKMLPQLNVRGNISVRDKHEFKEYENVDTGQTTLGRSISDEKTRRTVSASLTWNVLDFGISYLRARQTVVGNEIKRMERLRQAQNLAMEISAAYWKAVLAEQDLEYIREIEKEVKDYKSKAETMVAQKRIDPISAKGIEKKIAEMAITAAKLQEDISGARIELCRLMGLSPLTNFELVKEDFQKYTETMPAPDNIDVKTLEAISLRNRPEFFSADLEEKIEQDEARAALLSMFPGLKFDYSNYYDGNKYLVNNYWNTVGVGLSMDLLSIPSRYMIYKSRLKNISRVRFQRLLLTAGVIAQTHLALHDYIVKEEQFRLYDESYSISGDLLSMSRERHELGTLSDTIITQEMLENMVARLSRNRSAIDLLSAYNTLLVTLGFDYEKWRDKPMTLDDANIPEDIETRDILEIGRLDSSEWPGADIPEIFIPGIADAGNSGCAELRENVPGWKFL